MSRPHRTERRNVTNAAPYYPRHHQPLEDLKTQQIPLDPPRNSSCHKETPPHCPDSCRQPLNKTLYDGSVAIPPVILTTDGLQEFITMRNDYSDNDKWNQSTSFSSSPPPYQHTFMASQSSTGADTSSNSHALSRRRSKQSSQKRLESQDFEAIMLSPQNSMDLIIQYVGADSRYTLAGNHTGMYIRKRVRSSDDFSRLKEIVAALRPICDFLGFLHKVSKEILKPEQKGCLGLRVCYSSLTTLLGDFSSGLEIPVSDPQAPIVSKAHLSSFRRQCPQVGQLVAELSTELVKCVNTYRHRRSPSVSVVNKLQSIARTLGIWNEALGDTTFSEPAGIIYIWLGNHPNQVEDTRRIRGSSNRASPSMSDSRSSPIQYDASLFPPSGMYDPSHTYTHRSSSSNRSGHGQAVPHNVASQNYLSSIGYEPPFGPPTYYAQARAPGSNMSYSGIDGSNSQTGNYPIPPDHTPLIDLGELAVMYSSMGESSTGQQYDSSYPY